MEWDAALLVATLRNRPLQDTILAIVLAGSWARGLSDGGSDLDLLAVTDGTRQLVQYGEFQGLWTEVLYVPKAHLWQLVQKRATFRGGRPLYDPQGIAQTWLEEVNRMTGSPYMRPESDTARILWEITQGLRSIIWLAQHQQLPNLIMVRNAWINLLIQELYARNGRWLPSLRRQLDDLKMWSPEAWADMVACLQADSCNDIARGCTAAHRRWMGLKAPPALAAAPLLALT